MARTFLTGLVLGALLAGAAAWYLPAANLHREASIITVRPNGGNAELFRVRIPEDRLVAGTPDAGSRVPSSLEWPAAGLPVELEAFKLRNRDGLVVGVASRLVLPGNAGVEWVLHLPARGSLYFPMNAAIAADGERRGQLRAGTREFLQRDGALSERFIAGDGDGGQIELLASLVSTAVRGDE